MSEVRETLMRYADDYEKMLESLDIISRARADAEKRAEEAERKGNQLVQYLGSVMLAAHGLLAELTRPRPSSAYVAMHMRQLHEALDKKYDPTNGEALELTLQLSNVNSQLSSAKEEVERLHEALHKSGECPRGPECRLADIREELNRG